MGTANFSGTLIKNQLADHYSISLQGQALEIKLTGTVDNDTMSGTLELGGLGQDALDAPSASRRSGRRARLPARPRLPRPRRRAASPT